MGSAEIGVYSICYKEADWLEFNIRRMYDWVDAFSICVGPVEKLMGANRDIETAEALNAIPDPDGKITVTEGVWLDKNHMTEVATEKLDTPLIIQLDSDEVWPRESFDETIGLLRAGERKVLLHMYSFWKTPDYVMKVPDRYGWASRKLGLPEELLRAAGRNEPGAEPKVRRQLVACALEKREVMSILGVAFEGVEKALNGTKDRSMLGAYECCAAPWTPYLLDMHRGFRPCEHTHVSHIPPDLVWPNGEGAHWHEASTASTPLWHLCYIGESRMARKFEFFNKRAGRQVMPKPEYFRDWREQQLDDVVKMTGQLRRVMRYEGPALPDDVREFAERMAA